MSSRRIPMRALVSGPVHSPAKPRAHVLAILCALAAAMALTLAFAGSASALTPTPCPLPGSTFQGGDGNEGTQNLTTVLCPSLSGSLTPADDWQNLAGTVFKPDFLVAGKDNIFTGSEESEPVNWDFATQNGGANPPKDDILGAYSNTTFPSTPAFFYLAFHRMSTSSADTFMDFELNQSRKTWTNASNQVIPCRTDGDLLISYEIHPGSAVDPVDVNLYRWKGQTGSGSTDCLDAATGIGDANGGLGFTGSFGGLTYDSGFASISDPTNVEGAMNFAGNLLANDYPATPGKINNYLDTTGDGAFTAADTQTFDPGTFGEAALNLSATLQNGTGNGCFNFGQIQMHSRSSNALTSSLQDFVAPKPVIVRNCTASGLKYLDANANGTQDAGENGLGGWKIYADLNHNNQFDSATEPSTTSASVDDPNTVGDDTGTWTLSNLPTGSYQIREAPTAAQQTAGWKCSDPSTTDSAPASSTENFEFNVSFGANGGNVTGLKFGNFRPGSVSGSKFEDLNANGTQDAGDNGLSGWTINAFKDTDGNGQLDSTEAAAAAAATTTTIAGGGYSLSLNPGKYVVCETQQSGWTESKPTGDLGCPGAAKAGYAVTVTSNGSITARDFGNFHQGTVAGTKFEDLNANGSQGAGENGLSGWTIKAFEDTDGNGTLDSTEAAAAAADTATTANGGSYTLHLDPGKYVVCETQQSGWTESKPTGDLGCPGAAKGGYAVTVTSNGAITGKDFGNWHQGTVAGSKFEDLNANGTQDAGDNGLSGWTINAYTDTDGNGALSSTEAAAAAAATTTTIAGGGYSLTLAPGKYVVCETQQSGWTESKPSGDLGCPGAAKGGYAVTVASNGSITGKDFGNWHQGTVAGLKFEDLNANGSQGAGENGLSGWTVKAFKDTDGNG